MIISVHPAAGQFQLVMIFLPTEVSYNAVLGQPRVRTSNLRETTAKCGSHVVMTLPTCSEPSKVPR